MSRTASVVRATKETDVRVELNLDGSGRGAADTGMPFFDHMLQQLGKHAGWDLDVTCKGDLQVDGHHTVEDCGIAIGEALAEALGDKAGIRRFASITVPLDEAAVEVVLDLAGRNFVIHEVPVPVETIGAFDTGLLEDFVRAFAQSADLTIHVHLRYGRSPHHICEAEFKAMAKALGDACAPHGRGRHPIDEGNPLGALDRRARLRLREPAFGLAGHRPGRGRRARHGRSRGGRGRRRARDPRGGPLRRVHAGDLPSRPRPRASARSARAGARSSASAWACRSCSRGARRTPRRDSACCRA